ncbi:MAG: translation initiation factor IF-2 N-terminal domain-containing protein [Planctomycetota bacterium]|nr:translation initiation factor IF-2 N-terminal domain-containing protein [Planctomycetota bacterium]
MASKKSTTQPQELMLVNDVPGEETRIAILEHGHLEELFVERSSTATSVGNVYRGRVTNVEAAIQAAFVDFGHAQRGFLHISDLHPRYFPSGDNKENVGRKTARRDRPPIQEAIKRGDEILVQVLKEGIGTKGPTLTSYISIPGRMMVMMPHMDRVGVTRRVEDEDERREMRKILDTLDLPDNFGFILRTAGMGRSKVELKRDVAYLTRLWKMMERRGETAGTPCELYTESDVLIRTIRDVLRPSIQAIVVDSESAYERCTAFLKVIAPRSAPKVIHYQRALPLFHAFDLERQIELIRESEVPLPSGGRLVIESTEALVAIDVNSGRSRSARDSETNAYRTNMEAADEICRQLRLRDLGGLIIHDLIDMRHIRHRKAVEDRYQENLKRDRARSTILKISEFGILEMTRQRMRPDLRSSSFVECPTCRGNGAIMSADMVAADIVRHVGYLLHHENVSRVEIVVSPKVASVLLSTRRRHLNAIEERLGKNVDVRVSEAIALDRVDYYGYDRNGEDLALESLPGKDFPTIEEMEKDAGEPETGTAKGRSRRRRRRRGGSPTADATTVALSGELAKELEEIDREEEAEARQAVQERKTRRGRMKSTKSESQPSSETKSVRLYVIAKKLGVTAKDILARFKDLPADDRGDLQIKSHMSMVSPEHAELIASWFQPDTTESPDEEEGKPRRRRRRRGGRGRRGRGGKSSSGQDGEQDVGDEAGDAAEESVEPETAEEVVASKKKRRSRRRKPKSTEGQDLEAGAVANSDDAAASTDSDVEASPTTKKKRRRRRRKSGEASAETEQANTSDSGAKSASADSNATGTPNNGKKTRRRSGRGRKKTVATESPVTGSDVAVAAEPEVKPKPRRRLYGSRRGLTAADASAVKGDREE